MKLELRFHAGLIKMFFSAFLLGLVFLGTFSTFTSAQTAQPPEAAASIVAPPSPNDVRELMRLLADPSIRNWLDQSAAAQLDSAEKTVVGPSIRDQLAIVTQSIHRRLGDLSTLWTDIPQAGMMFASIWKDQLSNAELLRLITYGFVFLFIGAALEWLYHQYVKYRLMQIEFLQPATFRQKWNGVLQRFCLALGALFFFVMGSIGGFLTFEWPENIRSIVLDFLIMIVAIRLTILVSKIVFAPRLQNLRLVRFSAKQAKLTHRWVVALLSVAVFTNFTDRVFSQTLAIIDGSEAGRIVLSIQIMSSVIWVLLAFLAIWHLKPCFPGTETQNSGLRGKLTNTWPTYLTVLLVLVLVLYIMGATPLTGTIVIIGLLIPAISLAARWVDSLFDQASISANSSQLIVQNEGQEAANNTEKMDTALIPPFQIYRSVTKRVVRFLLIAVAILLLVQQWNINLFALSASNSIAGKIFDIAIDTIFALLLADLVWHWAKSAIDRRLADYTPPADGQSPGPEARMATLLPMLRMILMVTLLVVVFLSILTSFGVNVAPLIAGAGVLGVAIGFGAQALVRDVVSGIFFLIDDAFRIGEYIEIDNLRGTVESMSIRSLRVRHHRGMVHTIPFGELKSLTNYSRDWVIMKLEFRVPFDTDLKLVKKLVKKIGAELLENETYGHAIIQTLKSQGVRRMEEFNMVVGVKFMAKPGEQWLIRRDAYQKVRDAFDANGIGFAERNVKVQVIADGQLNEATQKAVMGAAQDAIEQQLPPAPVKDEP